MENKRESAVKEDVAGKPIRTHTSCLLPSERPFLTGEAILVEGVTGDRRFEYKFTKIDTSPDNGLKDAIQRRLASANIEATGFASNLVGYRISAIVTAAPGFRPDSPDVKDVLNSVITCFHPYNIDGYRVDELVKWPGFAMFGSDRGINVTFFQSCTDPVLFLTTGRFSTVIP